MPGLLSSLGVGGGVRSGLCGLFGVADELDVLRHFRSDLLAGVVLDRGVEARSACRPASNAVRISELAARSVCGRRGGGAVRADPGDVGHEHEQQGERGHQSLHEVVGVAGGGEGFDGALAVEDGAEAAG